VETINVWLAEADELRLWRDRHVRLVEEVGARRAQGIADGLAPEAEAVKEKARERLERLLHAAEAQRDDVARRLTPSESGRASS
jgi:hypothetical protein